MTREHRIDALLAVLRDSVRRHDSPCARELSGSMGTKGDCVLTGPATSVPNYASMIADLEPLDPTLQKVFHAACTDLAWRTPGYGRLPRAIGDRMAVAALVGPDALIRHENVALGLILIAPGLCYPSHRHGAEELYLALGGALSWVIDGHDIGPVRPGDFVHHRPWQPHAMITSDRSALLFWGWTGDIAAHTYAADPIT
jgi:mannose-6-phosphate isomerase-like protein (cupin superfamily)